MKNNRDVKFIIYQVLYIFVVCVIALKGANLDLSEVINKDNVVKKSYADSLRNFIDSLLALGLIPEIKFDTNNRIQNVDDLQKQIAQMRMQMNVVTTSPTITNTTIKIDRPNPDEPPPPPPNQQDNSKIKSNVQISSTFTQYLSYTIKNPYSGTLIISADGSTVASISEGSSGSFKLTGQKSITFRVGESSDTKPISPKPPPDVRLTKLNTSTRLSSIQATVGYRLTVSDIAPDQLKVDIKGPVKVTQAGSGTWDLTLSYLGSKSAFDSFADKNEMPFTVSFNINVTDAA